MTHKFKVGDRVHIIFRNELKTGVVISTRKLDTDIATTNEENAYLLDVEGLEILTPEYNVAPAPALVKVPQNVKEQIELALHYNQKNKENALEGLLQDYYIRTEYESESVGEWIANNFAKFISAVLDGYEVEKEPLYYVKVLNRGLGYLNCDTGAGEYFIDSRNNDDGIKTQYTETEIKALNEKLWECAVPVEEEAE
ncbi:DUF1642 domain-containing protein [Listeria booriae]|uniref:DUF1642 domain-containing protein n=1 Tax=Listeria booriae TaxID=1552123 RepID=UPI001623F8F5|nr:DUF1642 domain-containing protein [Listeria booriae]MBC1290528.1 DUF1642 domain-containing protein [Listeria booriae]